MIVFAAALAFSPAPSTLYRASTDITARESMVKVAFGTSVHADFLFYLLYRSDGGFAELKEAVPLTGIAPFKGNSFLPQAASVSPIARYEDIYALISGEDADIRALLDEGASYFPAFQTYWNANILPREEQAIAAWGAQNAALPLFARLEAMTRLSFPFDAVDVKVMALDPSGSSMQGPPTIFTTTRLPGLAWVIGHEGGHMILGPKGANWEGRVRAAKAIAAVREAGGSSYDIEEAMTLHLQARMAIEAGLVPGDFRSSTNYKAEGPRRTLLLAIERDWGAYSASGTGDAADFMIDTALRVFAP